MTEGAASLELKLERIDGRLTLIQWTLGLAGGGIATLRASVPMSDDGPESLTLRHLRALDQRLERLQDTVDRLVQVVGARFGAGMIGWFLFGTGISAAYILGCMAMAGLRQLRRRHA